MHYDKAPITEALIDIQVALPSNFTFEQLRGIKQHISSEYPREQIRGLGQAQFIFGTEAKAETKQQEWGLMWFSQDERQVFQAHLSGFTFSRLEPYETWERLRDEARRLWNIYQSYVKPAVINRVSVRYLNQFNFPNVRIDPEDYLNTYPHLSPHLPEQLRDFGPFSMSLNIPQPDLGGTLLINEALAGRQRIQNTVPVILDLALFVESPKIATEPDLWNLLERLRERKNLYFEACITDKTRELIS